MDAKHLSEREALEPGSVSIPNSRRVDFTAATNGRRYSISVGFPLEPPPEKGYRVFYVLDGYAYFGSATEAVRINGNAPATLVVGIGYPDDAEFVADTLERHAPIPASMATMPPVWSAITLGRFYDLSLPASDEMLRDAQLHGLNSRNVGGLDDFLRILETEVKPRVSQLARVDASDQAIFGHSLGGLAVLHALFTAPQAYRTFIAASPSIWWSDRAVLKGEIPFAAAVRAGRATPRVLITMGADEDLPLNGARTERREAFVQRSRMVEAARELSTRLQALSGVSPYEVEDYAVFPKQGHGISPWPALGRAISFAFPAGNPGVSANATE